MLSKISENNLEQERKIFENLCANIDAKKSTVFNAGAGAGKTFALVQCLKYVIDRYGGNLKAHNQKVMCITYTNVAANAVKNRIGSSSIVFVSTIHERIWDLINGYQSELVEIHKKKMTSEACSLKNSLLDEDKTEFRQFQNLSEQERKEFKLLMLSNKDLFHLSYDKPAKLFREELSSIVKNSEILRNVGNFKKIVNVLIKLENYKNCISAIDDKKDGYHEIKYDVFHSREKLHKMQISHDTLLEYGVQIISDYDLLKQIIIDKYPYMFIDEYQDTSDSVVKIMNILQQYADKINHSVFIGYYGDSVQNIYDEGVGNKLSALHIGLEKINKEFNRRSTTEIIDVANLIRKDDIKQESIYEDSEGGKIEFYEGTNDDISNFIEKTIEDWGITIENPISCLALTNENVARFSGFENLRELLSQTEYYRKNYEHLSSELSSNELSKLGRIPLLLYNIVKFIADIENEKTPVIELIPKETYSDMKITELQKLISELRGIKGSNMLECIENMHKAYMREANQDSNSKLREVIAKLFDLENEFSLEEVKSYFFRFLFQNVDTEIEDQYKEANEIIENLLKINMTEYRKWYKYISGKAEERINYYTYHGTKGLEFDNVIIILGRAFGRNRQYFENYFLNYNNSNQLVDKEKAKYEKARNLLYVAVTRAIKNLRILFIDDTSEIREGIVANFGEIKNVESCKKNRF